MSYDPELAALLSQPWSEGACRGYVISAMERSGFKEKVTCLVSPGCKDTLSKPRNCES